MIKNYTRYSGFLCLLVFLISISMTAQAPTLPSQSPSDVGRWSDPIGFGIVPVAVANLPDGRLITWSSQYKLTYVGVADGLTWTELFDPFQGPDGAALGEFQTNTNHDMFCPGINNLADGRILSAGGTTNQRTSIYDPTTGLWSVADEMNIPRGYQGNVTLSDGSVFTLGGSWSGGDLASTNGGKNGELWTEETGWILLPGISGDDTYTANDLNTEGQGVYRADNHLWLWAASNGKIFHAGPSEMMHWITVENGGAMEQVGLRANDSYSMKGTTVMFDVDRILKVGGAESYDRDHPAKDNSFVIDFSNENNVTVTPTANRLAYSRTMHNSTLLPNGEVLVTGGLDHAEVFSDVGARLTAEIYNPQTNSWRTVSGMQTPRTYHSVAILMVDGRVFVGGGGLCDSSNPDECVNHTDAEIYSPPYLFNNDGSLATRPAISAPETADYNTSIPVTGSAGITDFNLIRFSSATHSTNNEQRRIPVSFTGNGSYTVNIPDRNLLPPGYYMLFALDANGVPSVAETIQIGNSLPLSEDASLVLDLKFDDGSGSVARDDSQYGNNATIYDVDNRMADKTPSTDNWGSGLFGGALETDGVEFQSNTIVDVPYSTSMASVSNAMTVMAWVNRDDIVYNASVFTHDYPAFFFGFHNSLFKWEIYTSGGIGDCLAGYSPIGQWVHMAATYDGQYARLYVNGEEICSKAVSGNLVINSTEENFSSMSVSGFYERRENPRPFPAYNGSGVTDEVDGRIDEVKVYNRALDAAQIKGFYDQGVGLAGVPDCIAGSLTLEYRLNGGDWTVGNTLLADIGDQVYVRAQGYTEQYFVTTPYAYGPTLSSEVDFSPEFNAYQLDTNISFGRGRNAQNNDGLIDSNSRGQYVFTTLQGCLEVFTLNMNEAPVDCSVAGNIIPEYRLDGVWDSGENFLTVAEGTEVVLSMLPNGINVSITLPDGTVVGDDYNLGNVTPVNNGRYELVSSQGCETFIELTVTPNCTGTGILAEYQADGGSAQVGASATIDLGSSLSLGIQVDGLSFSISGPNGNTKAMDTSDLLLADLTLADSGTYTITSEEGCVTTFELTVNDPGAVSCSGTIIPEYALDGVWDSGENFLTVAEGTEVIFSMLPNGIDLTITLPDGTVVGNNYNLGNVTPANNGRYELLSAQGCETFIELTVTPSCAGTGIQAEYQADGGSAQVGASATIDLGGSLSLGIQVDGLSFSISGPNGNTKAMDTSDLLLADLTLADSGTYTITSEEGCVTTFELTVNDPGAVSCSGTIIPEYSLDGVWDSGENFLTVAEGTEVIFSMLPNGIDLTITLPDGTVVGNNYNLGNVIPADSGRYVLISEEGCESFIELTVESSCPGGTGIFPEFIIDGGSPQRARSTDLDFGSSLSLGIQQEGLAFSINGPNGNAKAMDTSDLLLESLTFADAGIYTLTSEEGCEVSFELTVNDTCVSGIIPEYRLDGVWDSGENFLTVAEGTEVVFSMLPNGIDLTIILPDGTVVDNNYNLGNVTPANDGRYILVSEEGCETFIELTVTPYCENLELQTEYQISSENTVFGASTVSVTEGENLRLSIFPDDLAFGIDGPNGNSKDLNVSDLMLENVSLADSGIYIFTTAEGCDVPLTVTVEAFDCETLGLQTEYQINTEDPVVGASTISVTEGENLRLSIFPDDLAFSINGPDGINKDLNVSDLILENLTSADSGIYVFTTQEGCEVFLSVTVETFDCSTLELQTEYRLGGANPVLGAVSLTATVGQSLVLGIKPDGIGFSVSGPNGNNKDLNLADLVVESLTLVDSGTYFFRTAEGCEIQLSLIVQEEINPNEPGDIDSIVIYPNPVTNGELTLYLKEFMNFELNTVIYDIEGRTIYQKIISAGHGEEEVLQLSQLSTGVYMLNIQVWRTGQYTIKKVVKTR